MKKALIVVAGLAIFSVSTLSAEANRNTGCGLGSMIFENQDTVAKQVLAATTNGTFGNQTFGITSGSLNCAKPVALVSNEKIEKFVADNMDGLAMDIAAGKGENLNTLASLMGIKDKEAFSSKLKANFSKIYSSTDVTSAEVIDAIASIAG